jgi:hypothetical protein
MLLADDRCEGTALYFDTNGDALQDTVNDGQTYRQNILVGSCAVEHTVCVSRLVVADMII